jgi:membrane protein insertase Oxa1/YidC/SpoIIIJ
MLLDHLLLNLPLILELLRLLPLYRLNLVLPLELCLSHLLQSLVFLLPYRHLAQTVNR